MPRFQYQQYVNPGKIAQTPFPASSMAAAACQQAPQMPMRSAFHTALLITAVAFVPLPQTVAVPSAAAIQPNNPVPTLAPALYAQSAQAFTFVREPGLLNVRPIPISSFDSPNPQALPETRATRDQYFSFLKPPALEPARPIPSVTQALPNYTPPQPRGESVFYTREPTLLNVRPIPPVENVLPQPLGYPNRGDSFFYTPQAFVTVPPTVPPSSAWAPVLPEPIRLHTNYWRSESVFFVRMPALEPARWIPSITQDLPPRGLPEVRAQRDSYFSLGKPPALEPVRPIPSVSNELPWLTLPKAAQNSPSFFFQYPFGSGTPAVTPSCAGWLPVLPEPVKIHTNYWRSEAVAFVRMPTLQPVRPLPSVENLMPPSVRAAQQGQYFAFVQYVTPPAGPSGVAPRKLLLGVGI